MQYLQKHKSLLNLKRGYFIGLFLLMHVYASAQTTKGLVTNDANQPLPFASIKFCNSSKGFVTDVNGQFPLSKLIDASCIVISYVGYAPKTISITGTPPVHIILTPSADSLTEVIVTGSQKNKLTRILNNVLAQKNKNNPDKYDNYQCHIYYKTIAGMQVADTVALKPGSKEVDSVQLRNQKELKSLTDKQHFFITETFTQRIWQKPQKLQEIVKAVKMSGFKNPLFTSLITNVIPFHSYNDFINLNGKDYHNPISKGLFQNYRFRLENEIINAADTVWVISFEPRKTGDQLSGLLYINSNGYAIANLIATAVDKELKRIVRIEQQYQQVAGKWFPEKLNYKWEFGIESNNIFVTGNAVIDSISYGLPQNFSFNKKRTVLVNNVAGRVKDSTWEKLRQAPLDQKEITTYKVIDSIGEKYKLDNAATIIPALSEGRLPIGLVDINLNRIYRYNKYEGSRLGLGLQTGDKLSKKITGGAWAGYGFKDRQWKYGLFTTWYADNYKETAFTLSYSNDVTDPGRLQVHSDLNANFVREFLLARADNTKQYKLQIQHKMGYFTTQLSLTHHTTVPQYNYTLQMPQKSIHKFSGNEASLNLRYAFAERTAPVFGKYYTKESKYPVIYANIDAGIIKEQENRYLKTIMAIRWKKNINRIGRENLLLIGGYIWSQEPLPLSKIYAGNGFATTNSFLAITGGMQTITPYEYYMDRFVNLYYMHDFTPVLYNLKFKKRTLSSSPYISVAYNYLLGSMRQPQVHQGITFAVPEKPIHETGLVLNHILRIKYLNLGYFNLNAGCFYRLQPAVTNANRYKLGVGMSFSL